MVLFFVDQERRNKLKSCYSGLSTNFNDVKFKSLYVLGKSANGGEL